MPQILTYWYFHLPNFILAALVYTLMGRFVLSFLVPENWDNYIWRAFRRLTDPVIAVVAPITPRMVPYRVILLFSMLWLTVARIAFALALSAAGMLPGAGGSP
jgi:uncharacterized protein YggT (Ycf19 family)